MKDPGVSPEFVAAVNAGRVLKHEAGGIGVTRGMHDDDLIGLVMLFWVTDKDEWEMISMTPNLADTLADSLREQADFVRRNT